MKLFRIRLQPQSAWRTPWQSDTLSGLICWAYARLYGGQALQQEIIDPALGNQPRFVLSDAFPRDLVPIPLSLKLRPNIPMEQLKEIKRAKWMPFKQFLSSVMGQPVPVDQLIQPDCDFKDTPQMHNTLSRLTGTTGDDGSLFQQINTVLPGVDSYLTVYARIEKEFESVLFTMFEELQQTGFGADVTTGKGQFQLLSSQFEPVDEMNEIPSTTQGIVTWSTFQPGADDPTNGVWETFTKFGKLGPDFGVENVFKRPLVMLRPGACFSPPLNNASVVGRAIPMTELLAQTEVTTFSNQSYTIIHYAFGLAVPFG